MIKHWKSSPGETQIRRDPSVQKSVWVSQQMQQVSFKTDHFAFLGCQSMREALLPPQVTTAEGTAELFPPLFCFPFHRLRSSSRENKEQALGKLLQLPSGLLWRSCGGLNHSFSKRMSRSTAPFWASPHPQYGYFSLAQTHRSTGRQTAPAASRRFLGCAQEISIF